MGALDLLMVAGEASGDLKGARLLARLRSIEPRLRPFGLGGEELRAGGLETLADSSEVAVVGITEALKVLPRARRIYRRLLAAVEERRAEAAVLIDFAEFNLRLARDLERRGLKVLYYVSPQIWAWRPGRVRTVARVVDRMLVLFPFEVEFYRQAGVEAVHVGHPVVDEVPRDLPQAWDRESGRPAVFRLALLPGSRPSEVTALLSPLLAAAGRLAAGSPGGLPVQVSVIRASTIPRRRLEDAIAAAGLEARVVEGGERFAAIAGAHLALCASGTATLEVGLLGTPMVVVYRVSPATYLVGRLLARPLPYVSLVNLVLGRRVVPELLQRAVSPGQIAAEAAALLADGERIAAMRAALAGLRERLGAPGASGRAAQEVAACLGWPAAVPEPEVARP